MSGLCFGVGCCWLFNRKDPDSISILRLTWPPPPPPCELDCCCGSFCIASSEAFFSIFRRNLKKVKEAAMAQRRRTKKTMTTVTPTSTADFDWTTLKTSTSQPLRWTPAGRSASNSCPPLRPRALWSSSFNVKFAMQPRKPGRRKHTLTNVFREKIFFFQVGVRQIQQLTKVSLNWIRTLNREC